MKIKVRWQAIPQSNLLYYVIFKRQLPSRAEAIGMLLALLGTFILVTHGHFNQLVVAPLALFWGLMSALAIAGDTLLPRPLLPKFGSINVNAWGLLVGGVQMNFIQPVWVGVPQFPQKRWVRAPSTIWNARLAMASMSSGMAPKRERSLRNAQPV